MLQSMKKISGLTIAIAVLGATAIGCGSDADDSAPATTASATAAPVTTEDSYYAPAPTASESTEPVSTADHVVVTQGFEFSPATLTIVVGETVEFQVGGGHNLAWDCTGDALTGTVTRTFDEPGTYSYCCTNHAGMSGVIIVE
jgi:plastocyanin